MAKINGIVQDPSGEVTRIFDRYSQFPLKQKQQHLIKSTILLPSLPVRQSRNRRTQKP